jgi:putative transcriptional regulator
VPTHHPDDELLLSFASGAAPEAEGVLLASHASLCELCSTRVHALEEVGGALLDSAPMTPLQRLSLDSLLERLDDADVEPEPVTRSADAVFPAPLAQYLGLNAHQVPWERISDMLSVYRPGAGAGETPLRLLRIRAGGAIPRHSHEGRELTLVLRGAFTDDSGHFQRGDFSLMEGAQAHAPVADPDCDCICLALNDGRVRLTGLLGRFLGPLIRF